MNIMLEELKEIVNILNLLRETSSTNEKQFILKKYKSNENLEKVFKYAYDRVTYTYGVRAWNVIRYEDNSSIDKNIFEVFDFLNERIYTGNSALSYCKQVYNYLPDELKDLFTQILDRDLKIGVSTKTLNKIWKGLIPKPNYNRCDVFNKKNLSKIHFPAFVQLKCDGTYREAYVSDGNVTFKTRSGEPDENPILANEMKSLPNGYYTGEFTIGHAYDPKMNRSEGNGNINSDNPDYENIYFTVWDYLTEDEYSLKRNTDYLKRISNLSECISKLDVENPHIEIVPTKCVDTPKEALEYVSQWMNDGLEGGVLKDFKMEFKNGTSKQQLKIKLKVDCEMRCVEFQEGNDGTKYEGMNKVIVFENDEGTISGRCSGMNDEMIEEVTNNPEKYIGKIVTVQFNDLSLAEGSETYALSHPRFAEWRDDKTETDTLEKVIELRDMAKNL